MLNINDNSDAILLEKLETSRKLFNNLKEFIDCIDKNYKIINNYNLILIISSNKLSKKELIDLTNHIVYFNNSITHLNFLDSIKKAKIEKLKEYSNFIVNFDEKKLIDGKIIPIKFINHFIEIDCKGFCSESKKSAKILFKNLDNININLKISLYLKKLDKLINDYKNDKNIISFEQIPIDGLKEFLTNFKKFRKQNDKLNYRTLKNINSREKINDYIKNLFKDSKILKTKFHCSSTYSICIEKRFRPCGQFFQLTFSNLDKIIHELKNKLKLEKEKERLNEIYCELEDDFSNMSFNSIAIVRSSIEIETINEVKKNLNGVYYKSSLN